VTLKSVGRIGAILLVVLLEPSAAGAGTADAYDRIVTAGDSLVDPGNAFVLLGISEVPPFAALVPDAPYARGGHHFSNGPTWVEQLGAMLGLKRSTKPAFRVPVVFSNYAVGSSRARPVGPVYLGLQVDRFLADFERAAPSDALYVVHIGGDDLRDALVALQTDPTFATSFAIIVAALTAIQDNIVALASAGAHTFLVPNAPDLAVVPEVRLAGPDAQAAGTFLATVFNVGLEALLSGLEGPPLGLKIFRLDIFSLSEEIVATPAAFGLTDAVNPCITPLTSAHPFCSLPDQFLFWDGIHPTRAGHAIIAERALEALNGP
jgi:phospholipase/lecithinase/hemolysin